MKERYTSAINLLSKDIKVVQDGTKTERDITIKNNYSTISKLNSVPSLQKTPLNNPFMSIVAKTVSNTEVQARYQSRIARK